MSSHPGRREFIKAAVAIGATTVGSSGMTGRARAACEFSEKPRHAVERLGFAGIGLRYQGSVDLHVAGRFGDVVAVCDVDSHVRDQAKASFGSRAFGCEDYRDLLPRKDIDAVIIGTPDHWHVKMAVDAMRAGKHVYVEKPVSLTIDEGKLLRRIAKQTGRVVQVGSWQRSDSRFRLAVEMVRAGRIGKLERVDVVLGKNKTGGPFEIRKPPNHLNWNLWQGQTADHPYIEERSHYTFRWWREYSGGQMTDWGAHHIDIAQWAIGTNPVSVNGVATYPGTENGYNVPVDFNATLEYPQDVRMTISDTGRNGIMFTGSRGRLFVNRGTISGAPVEALETKPLLRQDFGLYDFDNHSRPERAGKLDAIVNHMGNFVDCIEAGKVPISDVESQHRSASTCHLANISMQLGRKLKWDSIEEKMIDDEEANRMLRREQRMGFEVD